ncbi:MAG TPA: hypothetical protein VF384_18710 [Planctomycetota bacterium]
MPKNKDLKRLVRSRMQKTGESYTTARMHVVSRRSEKAPADAKTNPNGAARADELEDLSQRAGMRDAVIAAKTGRSWAEWVGLLDAAGGLELNHTQIAALVHEKYGVPGWWSQSVTVGYERIRGRRAVNQVAGGKFAVSKSRTFAVPVSTLARAFAKRSRRDWIGEKPAKERKTTAKVVRWIEADGSWVDVFLLGKSSAKSTASVQHSRLPSRELVEAWRARWGERLQALADWIGRRG